MPQLAHRAGPHTQSPMYFPPAGPRCSSNNISPAGPELLAPHTISGSRVDYSPDGLMPWNSSSSSMRQGTATAKAMFASPPPPPSAAPTARGGDGWPLKDQWSRYSAASASTQIQVHCLTLDIRAPSFTDSSASSLYEYTLQLCPDMIMPLGLWCTMYVVPPLSHVTRGIEHH